MDTCDVDADLRRLRVSAQASTKPACSQPLDEGTCWPRVSECDLASAAAAVAPAKALRLEIQESEVSAKHLLQIYELSHAAFLQLPSVPFNHIAYLCIPNSGSQIQNIVASRTLETVINFRANLGRALYPHIMSHHHVARVLHA